MEVGPDGLYATLDLTQDGAEVVRKNPRLGVSARIIEGLEHADGRKFGRAVLHVLGTLDPRVTGMKPWEEIALSHEVEDTLDLSNEEYDTEKESTMTQQVTDTAPSETETGGDVDLANTGEQDTLSDDVFDTLAADESDTEDEGSNELELARAENAQNAQRLQVLEQQLADERASKECERYVSAGVPPAMVDLARPILSLPSAPVIDLARNGDSTDYVDLAGVVRKILDEAKGTVDLHRELGGTFDGEDTESKYDAWVNQD